MPYIPQERRDEIQNELELTSLNWYPKNAGDLNFAVTCFIDNYLVEKGVKYAKINEMIGALECCKLELYRMLAAPYEDVKANKNGGVYMAHIEGNGY